MSEDLKLIQYPERPLKITLEFKNKNIMHITILILPLVNIMGWDSSVGIATGYGLDGLGIESWRG
jgi:hypothetical protein